MQGAEKEGKVIGHYKTNKGGSGGRRRRRSKIRRPPSLLLHARGGEGKRKAKEEALACFAACVRWWEKKGCCSHSLSLLGACEMCRCAGCMPACLPGWLFFSLLLFDPSSFGAFPSSFPCLPSLSSCPSEGRGRESRSDT